MKHTWICSVLVSVTVATAAELPCEVSWIGNAWGGKPQWVPQDVDDLFVTSEGDVYTHVGWEEGGGNVTQFDREGVWKGVAKHTHGWGYGGGEAVTANAKYVFIAQHAENEQGHLNDAATWPPKGFLWWGVSRRLRTDFQTGVAFEGGKGGKGDTLKQSFKVVGEYPDDGNNKDGIIRGLCANQQELFVAVKHEGIIRVYDTETLVEKRSWRIARPDRMVLDAHNSVWVLLAPENDEGVWTLAGFELDGREVARMAFGASERPADLAIDNHGRLLVSDVGVSQQILMFDGLAERALRRCGTLGEKNGIFGGSIPGRVGPYRFNCPRGIGCDAAGNIYVANSGGTGGGSTVLESYTSDGALRWRRCGLFFIDVADLDAESEQTIYSKEERFSVDLQKPIGTSIAYAAYTVNPWKYPDDPRIHIWSGNAWFAHVRGVPLLFVSNMGQDIVQAFRFNPAMDGEIAIPAALFAKRKVRVQTKDGWPRGAPEGAWCWTDRNGDGAIQTNEYEVVGAASSGCVFVDDDATIWRVAKEAAIGVSFKAFTTLGAPTWDWVKPRTVSRPAELSELRRFKIDVPRDVAAFGGDAGSDKHQHWKPMGPVVAVYRDVLKGQPVKLWSAVLPYADGSKGHESAEPMSMEIAGDYLFVCYTRGLKDEGIKWAFIKIYGLRDGRFIGNLVPERATGELGLLDLEDALRVKRLRDGSYLLFLEDDYKAKNVMIRWRPS